MEHYSLDEFEITNKNYRNFTILANYLDTVLEDTFDMENYVEGYIGFYGHMNPVTFQEQNKELFNCGCVACALGHAATIPSLAKQSNGDDWGTFSEQVFGCGDVCNVIGDWVFGWEWVKVDNTPKGAAQRIRYMLHNGVPVNAIDQYKGHTELCYKGY